MASDGKNDDLFPPYSPQVEFQDPFASLEGGIGSLNIKIAEANGAYAFYNAASTNSAQSRIFDGGVDSMTASSRASNTSLTTLNSQEILPSVFLPSECAKKDVAVQLSSLIPRSSENLVFPTAELDYLESVESDTLTSHGSSSSSEGNPTPRPSSRIGESGQGASLDGGVDLPSSYGARLSPIPFTTSPASITRPASVAASMQSYRSYDCAEDDWNIETLREMTDLVREALLLGSIPTASVETLSEILKALLIDEQGLGNTVGLDTVALTYLDKTLDAILSQTTRNTTFADPSIQELFLRATSLQHRWQQRFKERYFSIDDVRIKDIRQNILHDLTLNERDWKTGPMWLVGHNEPISHQQGDLGFEVGSWWLNIACAFRDGIVGGVDDRATKGPYNVTALPLLSGEEVEGPTLNMYEYVKRGASKEMPFSILGNRGGPIRILRGHALKSKFAPKIGVRYDGLYIVKQYGHKLVNAKNNIYKCTLILERLTGQKPINDIILLPTPSQMDSWALYIRIIGDHIRARQGDVAFSEWRELLDRETMDKDEFLRTQALEASFSRYKVVKRKQITSKD